MMVQEFLEVLARVQARQEAGCFATQPDVCLLVNRAPAVVAELIGLRTRCAVLEQEAAWASQQQGLFSSRPQFSNSSQPNVNAQ